MGKAVQNKYKASDIGLAEFGLLFVAGSHGGFPERACLDKSFYVLNYIH